MILIVIGVSLQEMGEGFCRGGGRVGRGLPVNSVHFFV